MTNCTKKQKERQLEYLAGTKLTLDHVHQLLTDRKLDARWVLVNCESVTQAQAKGRGFTAPSDGILLKGAANGQEQFKPDNPTVTTKANGKQKANKYLSPKGDSYDVMLPQHPEIGNYWTDLEALKERCYTIDGHPCLVITEGVFKAISLSSNGVPTISLIGVEMGLTPAKNDPQGKRYLVPTLERFAKAGIGFIFLFDADCVTNKNVIKGQEKLVHVLESFNVPIYNGTGLWAMGRGKGVDDYIANWGFKQFNHEVLSKVEPISDWLVRINQELKAEGITFNDDDLPRDIPKISALYNQAKLVIGDRIKYNELTNEIELDGKPLKIEGLKLDLALEFNLELKCSQADLETIVTKLASNNRYNPVKDYLEECHKKYPNASLDGLAKKYFGSTNPLHQIYLRKTLIAAVARVYDPGCKVDTTLILQGGQGVGKSTFFRVLAGDDWFCDDMGDIGNKDERLKMHQNWLVEWAELENVFGKKSVSDVKAFLTSKFDNIRPPYGRKSEKMPRRSVIVGSTNKSEFLTDPTGSRRYQVIPVNGTIPINLLKQERDAIWGAAVAAYKNGETWWLDSEEQQKANEHNRLFSNVSPWQDEIEIYLEGKISVTTDELLRLMGVDKENLSATKRAQNEISDIMTSLGWKKVEGIKDENGKRKRGYKRPVVTQPEPEPVQTDCTTHDSCAEGCASSNTDDTRVYTDAQPIQQNSLDLKNDVVTSEVFEMDDRVKRKGDGACGIIVGKTSNGKLTIKPDDMKNSRWYLCPDELVKIDS